MWQQCWHGQIQASEEDVVTSSVEVHARKISLRRLKVVDGVSAAQPHQFPGGEHPKTEVALLALMNEVLSVSADTEENVASHGMSCSDKAVGDPNMLVVGSALTNRAFPVHIY